MADERTPQTARDRIVSDVDRMCRGEGQAPVAELSDRAALLVACGLVEPRVGDVVLARLHRNLPFPTVNGFHQVRIIEEQRHDLRRILGTPVPSQFMAMLPYLVTVLVVAGLVGRSRGPAAAGSPYVKE